VTWWSLDSRARRLGGVDRKALIKEKRPYGGLGIGTSGRTAFRPARQRRVEKKVVVQGKGCLPPMGIGGLTENGSTAHLPRGCLSRLGIRGGRDLGGGADRWEGKRSFCQIGENGEKKPRGLAGSGTHRWWPEGKEHRET